MHPFSKPVLVWISCDIARWWGGRGDKYKLSPTCCIEIFSYHRRVSKSAPIVSTIHTIARPTPVSLEAHDAWTTRGCFGVPRPNTDEVEPINVLLRLRLENKMFDFFTSFFHGFPELVISYLMAPNVMNRLSVEGFFTSLNPLHGVLSMIFGFLGENGIGIACFWRVNYG